MAEEIASTDSIEAVASHLDPVDHFVSSHFGNYLKNRELIDPKRAKFFGELREPETVAELPLAGGRWLRVVAYRDDEGWALRWIDPELSEKSKWGGKLTWHLHMMPSRTAQDVSSGWVFEDRDGRVMVG